MVGPAAEGELLHSAGKEEEDATGGHDEAKKALKELGVDGMIEGKALEGYWE